MLYKAHQFAIIVQHGREFIMFHFDTNFETKTLCEFKILANIFCHVFVSSGLHEIWIETRYFPYMKMDLNMPLAKTASILSRPQCVDICSSSSFSWPMMMCLHYFFLAHIVFTLSNENFKMCRVVIYSFEQLQTYQCNQGKIVSFPTTLFILQCNMSSPKLNNESWSIWYVKQHNSNFVKVRSCWNHS